jgi:hypothetical protein
MCKEKYSEECKILDTEIGSSVEKKIKLTLKSEIIYEAEKSIVSIEAIKEEICGNNIKDFYYGKTHKLWIVEYISDFPSDFFETFIDMYEFFNLEG